MGLSWWLSDKEPACQSRRHGFKPRFGKIPHATEQVSPFATTPEPVLQSPGAPTTEARRPQSLCPTTREAAALQQGITPTHTTRGKPMYHQRPSIAKNQKKHVFKGGQGWLCSNKKNLYFKEEEADPDLQDLAFCLSSPILSMVCQLNTLPFTQNLPIKVLTERLRNKFKIIPECNPANCNCESLHYRISP